MNKKIQPLLSFWKAGDNFSDFWLFKENYLIDMLVTYLMLLVSITFTLINIDLRSPKTYWVLFVPVPTTILIPIKNRAEKETQERFAQEEEKYRIKKSSQPLVCKGCHNFDFSQVDDLEYACKLYPHGTKDDICKDHQTSEEWQIVWGIQRDAKMKAHNEAVERLKPVKPQVCESCLNYQGVDEKLELKVCWYYPNGVEGNKCNKKSDGRLRLSYLFGWR